MNILDNNGLIKEPSGNLWSGRTRVNILPLGGLQSDWIRVVDLGELNIWCCWSHSNASFKSLYHRFLEFLATNLRIFFQ